MNRRNTDAPTAVPASANLSELVDLGLRQMEALIEAQSTLASRIQEASGGWMKRAEVETALAADLATKLTNARSLPEAAAAWQDWTNRRVALAGEDTKRAMNDVRSMFAAAAIAGTSRGEEGWQEAR
jgi:hypothetical protein